MNIFNALNPTKSQNIQKFNAHSYFKSSIKYSFSSSFSIFVIICLFAPIWWLWTMIRITFLTVKYRILLKGIEYSVYKRTPWQNVWWYTMSYSELHDIFVKLLVVIYRRGRHHWANSSSEMCMFINRIFNHR